LVEVAVVLSITGIILAVAIPSFHALQMATELRAATTDLLGHLHLARSEAMSRKARVVVCKSNDREFCVGTGTWEQGWIVFHDRNNNATREPAEALLQAQAALGTGLRLLSTSSVAKYVSYGPTGTTLTVGGGFQAGTLTVCEQSATPVPAKQVVIAAGGRPRVQSATLSCP